MRPIWDSKLFHELIGAVCRIILMKIVDFYIYSFYQT